MSGSYSDASRERQPSPKRSGMGAWMSKFFRRAGASDGPEAGQAPAPMRLAPEPEKTLPPEEAMRKKELQAAMQAGTKTLPPEAEEPKAGGGQTDDEERVKGLLRILDGPVNSLYPFLRQQIQGCIGGTPNFISPEQASSTFKDPDNISHFMLSMRDVPYIYRQIKPVATAFQRFLNVYLKLHKAVAAQPMVWRQAENVEMQRRLDVRSFEKIMKDVEFLGYSINRVKMEKDFMGVMGYGTQVSMLLQEWERFNNLFQKAAPEIMELLHHMYQGVKDQKWDKTGPYAPEGPRGEDDAELGKLGKGVLDDPSSAPDGWVDMGTDHPHYRGYERGGRGRKTDMVDPQKSGVMQGSKTGIRKKPGKTTVDYVPGE
jgi:hypothetical protein